MAVTGRGTIIGIRQDRQGLGFVDGRPFEVIATDGGLLPSPVTLDRMPLSPGERAEIVVTFQPGEEAVLRSFPRGSGAGLLADHFGGHDDTFDVLQIRAADDLTPAPPPPARLADIERIDPADAVQTRTAPCTFRLSGTRTNGQDMALDRIDAVATSETTEICEVEASGQTHNLRVDGVQFQVLEIDGAPPPPLLEGWNDTIEIPAGSTTRLLLPFGTQRQRHALHVPLPHPPPRGQRHNGTVRVVEPGETEGTRQPITTTIELPRYGRGSPALQPPLHRDDGMSPSRAVPPSI